MPPPRRGRRLPPPLSRGSRGWERRAGHAGSAGGASRASREESGPLRRRIPGWGAAFGLALVICGALLALAGRTTLWDRDEPRFAQATVEMIGLGDYLVPTFNGRLRPDKPILTYWLMSLPMRWLGPTALAARAWSAIAIALTALLTFAIARRLLPPPAGLWPMAILAATPLALAEGQAATADAVLLAAVTAAFACFIAALDGASGARGARGIDATGGTGGAGGIGGIGGIGGTAGAGGWWAWLGLGLALGLALLAKGPVGLAVPGLGIAATLWLLRRPAASAKEQGGPGDPGAAPAPRSAPSSAPVALASPAVSTGSAVLAWRAALAGLLGVALFCAWGLPANRASGGELARLGLGRHVLGRATGAMEGHGGGGPLAGIPYYALVLWVGFAPWSPYLPAAISAALGGRLGGRRGRALLAGWTVPALLLMAVVATRLPHYILPVWPALALAVGGTLEAERRGGLSARDRRWLRRGAWLLAALLVAVLLGAAALAAVAIRGLPYPATAPHGAVLAHHFARDLLLPVLTLAAVLLAAGGAALREHLAGRIQRSALTLLGGVAGAALVAGAWVAPVVERWKPAPRLAAAIRAVAVPGVPVVTFRYGEPSLVFYLRRGTVAELADAAAVAAWCREPAPGILVLPRSALAALRSAPGAGNLREVAAAYGLKISNGSFVELVALQRQPPSLAAGPLLHHPKVSASRASL
jgi:4-amino-4-deoxy-L-arabinose transferase-like glycosyltransferase